MKRILVLALVLAVVPAAAASSLREKTVAGPVSALGVAGAEIGYADEYKRGCQEIRLWGHDDRSDRRLATHCFASTSTGNGVGGVIAYSGRALWLTYTGGNIREWSLWTKGFRSKTRRIAFLTADVDGPPPIVLGHVWEGSLPYAIGNRIVVLAPNGSRVFTLSAAARVVALSAHSRGYAAVLASGHVLTISGAGEPLREHPFAAGLVQDAVLTAQGLVVKTDEGLEVHRDGTIRKIALPRGARFLGLSEGVVAYGTGRELRLRGLTSGRDTLFRTLAPGFHAQLSRRGLGYASGRTLGFVGGLRAP